MRKLEQRSEQVEVNGKVFTINEIDPVMVLDFVEGRISFDASHAKEILQATCGISLDDIREHKISFGQISEMYSVFKEVNAAFFQVFPLEEALAGIRGALKSSIVQSLSGLLAPLSQPDTPGPGSMAGDISVIASPQSGRTSKKK